MDSNKELIVIKLSSFLLLAPEKSALLSEAAGHFGLGAG
jgi:hypothetical protein